MHMKIFMVSVSYITYTRVYVLGKFLTSTSWNPTMYFIHPLWDRNLISRWIIYKPLSNTLHTIYFIYMFLICVISYSVSYFFIF